MTREERTVLLAMLVPIAFGAIMYIEQGTFIFPFPLNEVVFFIASIAFAVRTRFFFRNKSIFSIGFAFFNLIGTTFFWTFFLPDTKIEQLAETGTFDLLKLISLILLVIWAGITLIKGKDNMSNALFLGFFILLAASEIFQQPVLQLFATLIPFASVFKNKDHFPYHLLWLLLSLLSFMKFVMLSI
jgi:hypothetical protein